MGNFERPPRWTLIFLILLLLGMFASAWSAQGGCNWLLVALCLVLFLAVIGWHITGRPAGILITERNLISLSRFQMVLWTVIILSGYFTMTVGRIKAGNEDALAIAMDWHLWALMGISTASLIGSPLALGSKKNDDPVDGAVTKTAHDLKEDPKEIEENRQGVLYSNDKIEDARFTDMFQGDELQNTKYLDLAKVQMFLFTFIAGVAYAATLWKMFDAAKGAPGGLEIMPGLSQGLIALLGISHAGYLSSKKIEHTKTK